MTDKPKPKPRTPRTILAALLAERQAGGEAYARADELLAQLLQKCEAGELIELADGRRFQVHDNFTKNGQPTNKAWKPCGLNRFDLKEIKRPPASKKG